MPCDNDDCGQTRTPCDTAIPETCEALPTVTSGSRLVVEDENSCKRGLTSSAANSILLYDVSGNVIWRDGSASRPIILPQIQAKEGASSQIIVSDNGTIKGLQGTTGAAEPELLLEDGTNFVPTERSKVFGTGTGVLIRQPSGTKLAAFSIGTEGQILKTVSGAAAWSDPSEVQANAFRDIANLRISYTNATSITVTITDVVLKNVNTGTYFAKTNSSAIVVNAATVGANGIDAGSLSASALFWVFAIYNKTTDTLAALISSSPSSPALPSGYTYQRLIGLFRTTSGSQVPAGYFQSGTVTNFGPTGRAQLKLYSAANGIDSGVVSSFYPAATYVRDAYFQIGIWGTGTVSSEFAASIASSNADNPALPDVDVYGGSALTGVVANKSFFSSFTASIPPSGTSYWRTAAAGFASGDLAGLYLSGFDLVL